MAVSQVRTKKSSRVGNRTYKVPSPLRFESMENAKTYIRKNKLRITQHVSDRRGHKIQVVDSKGKPRTISVVGVSNARPR